VYSFVPTFTQIGRDVWEARAQIHLRPFAKYDCRQADFHETHAFWTGLQETPIIQLHENLAEGLVPQNWSLQTGDMAITIKHSCLKLVRNFRKATISFMSMSVCQHGKLGSHGTDFHNI
jgi:hypothetical protein